MRQKHGLPNGRIGRQMDAKANKAMGERLPLKTKVDDKDLIILAALGPNARTSHVELARLTGLTEGAIRGRIDWLEAHGVIIGYRTIIKGRHSHGGPLHWVEFALLATQPEAISRFERGLLALPGVSTVDRMERHAYLLRIAHATPAELVAAMATGAGVRVALQRVRRIETALSREEDQTHSKVSSPWPVREDQPSAPG